MNWHLLIGIVAGLIQLYAVIPYVRSILARETRPNVVSWVLWTLLQLITIWIMMTSDGGISWSLILVCAMTFNTSLVVVLCLAGYGDKEFGWVEKACLAIALVTIGLYVATDNGPLAIGFNILADLIAAAPTVWKTWRDPKSEAFGPWAIITVAAVLGVLSVEIASVESIAFPMYLVCVNGSVAALAYFGQRNIPKPVA